MNTGLISRRNVSVVAQISILGLLLVYLVAHSWDNPMHRAFWVAMFLTALVMGGAIGLAAYVKSSFAKKVARFLHTPLGTAIRILFVLSFATSQLWRHATGDGFLFDAILGIIALVVIFSSLAYFAGFSAGKRIDQREAG